MGKHFKEILSSLDGTVTISMKAYYDMVEVIEERHKQALEVHRVLTRDRTEFLNELSNFNKGLIKKVEHNQVWNGHFRHHVEEIDWYSKDEVLNEISENLLNFFENMSIKKFKEFKKRRKNK